MPDDKPLRMILIVTGSTLRAEEMDRPLAYYLRKQVELSIAQRVEEGIDEIAAQVVVTADFRWMNDEELQDLPTISIGGPGVNALAHHWFDSLPFSLAVDEQFCIQMDPELIEPRASLWGMDNATTQIAVSVFTDRFLARFLDRAAEIPGVPEDSEESGESDDLGF